MGDEDDDYAGYDERRLDFRVHCCSFGFHGEAQVLILHKMKDETPTYLKLPSRKLKKWANLQQKKKLCNWTLYTIFRLALMGESLFIKLHRKVIAFLHSWNPVDNIDKWTQNSVER